MRLVLRAIFLVLLLSFPSIIWAQVVEISKGFKSAESFSLQSLEDTRNIFSVEEALSSLNWKEDSNHFTKGYTPSSYWFRFEIKNKSNQAQKVILEFTEEFFTQVDLYHFQQRQLVVSENGLRIPVAERRFKDANPVFEVSLQPYETKPVLLKLKSNVGFFGALKLWEESEYYQQKSLRYGQYIFLLGALLAILIYNTFLFFQLQEKIYLYYIAYGIFFVGWILLYSGYITLNFEESFHQKYHLIMPLAFVFLIKFSQTLLETSTNQIRTHFLLNVSIFVYLASIVIIPFNLLVGFEIHNLITTFVFPLLLFAGWQAIRLKHPLGKIFTFALFVYFIGMTVIGLMALGLLPYNVYTRNAPFPGSLIEIVTFSLALAYRINLLKAEKLAAQQNLIKVETENRKQLELKVRNRTKALENSLKNEQKMLDHYMAFSSIISHEFRNPLGIIKSQLSVMQKERSKNIDNVDKRAKTISSAVSRLELIFEDWITNDRLNNQSFNPDYQHFQCSVWLNEIADLLKQNHPTHQLRISGSDVSLYADEALIKILLFNLVDNACKYSPKESVITLKTIETSTQTGFMVCDQGQGISEKFKQQMFEPYTRELTQQGQPKTNGVGLGLSVVKRIVDAHNGQIFIENAPSKGTCIRVLLNRD